VTQKARAEGGQGVGEGHVIEAEGSQEGRELGVVVDEAAHRDRGGALNPQLLQQPVRLLDFLTDLGQPSILLVFLYRGGVDGDQDARQSALL